MSKRFGFIKRQSRRTEIDPDQVLIDASNLPNFDRSQFEGRIEHPVEKRSLFLVGGVAIIACVCLLGRLGYLQVSQGTAYAQESENNRLRESVLFAARGVITDRTGKVLAGNKTVPNESYAARDYITVPGFGHVLGYVSYPRKDTQGFYYQEEVVGKDGIESELNTQLQGINGLKLTETDALGNVVSENLVRPPQDGKDVTLSIDAGIQEELYTSIADLADKMNYQGGAGVIMDVRTGEVLAMTSFPEYSPEVLSTGTPHDVIAGYQNSSRTPYLDRAVDGLYAPGSIVKPFIAAAALTEGIISPDKQILSTGSISVPNPYDPAHPSIFKDWRAQGWVDMRHAIAVSSDVYFYEVGGGFQDQRGLGISNIDKYLKLFGFGGVSGIAFGNEPEGNIPTPEWKAENFPDDPTWRLGDTYHTTIGQYGFQVTPVQMVRNIASLANGGTLLTPVLTLGATQSVAPTHIPISDANLQIVREGMRLSAQEGTAQGLSNTAVKIAGKTGTAQIGVNNKNQFQNSWVVGFFPYDNPHYAFAVVMERGKAGTQLGATYAMRQVIDWMAQNTPEYFK